MQYFKESLLFDIGYRRKKRKNIVDALDELDDDNVVLPSSFSTKKNNKEEIIVKDGDEEDEDSGEWISSLTSFSVPKLSKSKSKYNIDFLTGEKSKKKKKKKKHDYKKDFEPEMALLKNIQLEQDKFVVSLQRKYNQLENSKTANRGIGKFTTDLITSITTARNLSMQVVDKIVSVKKTVADLEFKERKEFGTKSSEAKDINNYASNMLKEMVSLGRNNIVNGDNVSSNPMDYSEVDDYDLSSSISSSLGEIADADDVFLKYENSDVEVVVEFDASITSEDINDKYDYVAYDKDGNIVEDYPLPNKNKLTINESTEMATDMFGSKYRLIMI